MGLFGELGFDISEDKDNFGRYMPGCLLTFSSTCSLPKTSLLSWSELAGRASAPLEQS